MILDNAHEKKDVGAFDLRKIFTGGEAEEEILNKKSCILWPPPKGMDSVASEGGNTTKGEGVVEEREKIATVGYRWHNNYCQYKNCIFCIRLCEKGY